jgi:HEAT repeat protein
MQDFIRLARSATLLRRTLRALDEPPDVANVRRLLTTALDERESAQARRHARRRLARYARASEEVRSEAIAALKAATERAPNSRMVRELANMAWSLQLASLTHIHALAVKAAHDKMIELGAKSSGDVIAVFSNGAQPVNTRVAAVGILGTLGWRVPVAPLITVMRESSPNLVWAIAHAIGETRSTRFTRPLMSFVRHSEPGVSRQAAISALGDLNDARAVPLLTQILRSSLESEDSRVLAANALSLMAKKREAQKALIALTSDLSPLLRYSAICALSPWVADSRIREALQARLEDRAPVPNRETVAELVATLLHGDAARQPNVSPS